MSQVSIKKVTFYDHYLMDQLNDAMKRKANKKFRFYGHPKNLRMNHLHFIIQSDCELNRVLDLA